MTNWGKNPVLEKEKINELMIVSNLNDKNRRFVAKRYTCLDGDGNETYQLIETKYGKKRCPGIYVQEDDVWEEIIMRIEVKHTTKLWNNEYLIIECEKFNDYVCVQSSEEVDGRIIFLVDSDGIWYWETLYKLDLWKEKEYINNDKFKGNFYKWKAKNLRIFKGGDEFFSARQ